MKSVRYSQLSKSATVLLALFTLLLLSVSSSGVLSSSLSSLQTSTAPFAQTPSSSSSLADEIIDETATSVQDSSAGDNILGDSNEFGDEDAAIEQDNEAEQDAANVGLQDEDATQEQDQTQDAANTNLDLDVQEGVQRPPPGGDGGQEPECTLEITADKEIYEPEDVVAITITNTGDEPIEFPNSALGLQIKNVDTGEVFPLVAAQVVTTLEPGESRTFEFTYEELVSEIGTGLISATVMSECGGVKEVTFRLSAESLPEEDGKIAFTSQRDGQGEIYVMNADGSEQTNISNNPAFESHPSWSPDGTKIAFGSNRDGNDEIYVMNADGSEQTNISNNPEGDYAPDWSPDGTKITFTSLRDGNFEIYVMNADDGSDVTRLTDNPFVDEFPAWSPDGTKIAFDSNRDIDEQTGLHNEEIYIMNTDGSNPTRLTTSPNFDGIPDWSPEGTKIAFSSGRDGNAEIYVMNADGSNPTRLTTTSPANEFTSSWSPDGTKIAFDSNKDDDSSPNSGFEIYVMNADGSNPTRLTTINPTNDDSPDWGPATDTEP